jgi:signal transduction histidine kinase
MKRSIRLKLILVVLTILLPLLLVSAYSSFMVIQKTRHESSWMIRLIAEEIAKDFSDSFEATFNVIDALATNPAVVAMDANACDRLFAKLLPSYPLHLNILAARSDGCNVGSAVAPQQAHQLNYTDKEWFQVSRQGKRLIGNLHVSKLFKSPAIMMAGPVYGQDGTVKGVIGFPLNLDELRGKLLHNWQLPPRSLILVVDAKGNVLVDTQHREHVGENLAHFPLLQAARRTVYDYLEMSASDGVRRLFYVTTPKNTDWRVLVGVPSESIIKTALTANNPFFFGIIVTALLGLTISIIIARRLTSNISQIAEGLNSIGRGDLGHRLQLRGDDELADIAGYFNEMAETHQRYEQEITAMNAQLEQRVEERTAQLVSANRELDSFVYSVSHDLRAPLRNIDAFSTILLDDHGDRLDDEGKGLLHRIHNGCLRMNELIEDLLMLSRVSRAELNRKTVDLTGLAYDIADELHRAEPDRQVEFAIESAMVADVDPTLMRTVLENLLGNAWKFTRVRAVGRIAVGAMRGGDRVTYFVRDNGAGFNQELADRLFTVFQRLHSAEEFEGSGIGLASARKIITRHGGEIWAEGKEGEGATFFFTLG